MNMCGENHSSRLRQTTRVKPRRKQAKITVGITISPHILAEARNRNLNLSRICEQALGAILDYIPQENTTKSSKSLNGCSLPRENPRAGSSAWYERRIRNAEVAGSNPARSTEPSLLKEASLSKGVPPFVIVFGFFGFSIASLRAFSRN